MAREFQIGDGCACFDGFLHDVIAVGFVEGICASVRAALMRYRSLLRIRRNSHLMAINPPYVLAIKMQGFRLHSERERTAIPTMQIQDKDW